MTRVGKMNRTHLRTHTFIYYYKQPLGFIKSYFFFKYLKIRISNQSFVLAIIETNSYSAIEDNNKYLGGYM
jgi:hypothetical protein